MTGMVSIVEPVYVPGGQSFKGDLGCDFYFLRDCAGMTIGSGWEYDSSSEDYPYYGPLEARSPPQGTT